MVDKDTQGPVSEQNAVEAALEHVRKAEHDLAEARNGELRAEHELEIATEDLERAEHEREFKIIINGRQKVVHKEHLSFSEIVALAFPDVPPDSNTIYTVTYRNGGNVHRPEGTLVNGENVRIKNGTIFDVTPTDKS
jgi:hypothetical protein